MGASWSCFRAGAEKSPLLKGSDHEFPYELQDVLHRGKTSTVYIGVKRGTTSPLCVIKKKPLGAAASLDHSICYSVFPVVTDVVRWRGSDYFISRYVPGTIPPQLFPTQQDADEFLSQMLNHLIILHSTKIVHRDIRRENIILSADGKYNLINFEGARYVDDDLCWKYNVANEHLRSPKYADICSRHDRFVPQNIIYGNDVFQLGVAAYMMLEGYYPFCHESDEKDGRYTNIDYDRPRPFLRAQEHHKLVIREMLTGERTARQIKTLLNTMRRYY